MKVNKQVIFDIKVLPKSSRGLVVKDSDKSFKVYLTKPAREGQANKELIELLAEYFQVKKYMVSIIKGQKGRNKVVKITQ